MTKKKLLAFLLASVMLFTLAACTKTADTPESKTPTSGEPAVTPNNQVLVIATAAAFEEKWNPFLAESAYDNQVMRQIFTSVTDLNAENEVVPSGGSITSELTASGGVLYTVSIQPGMYFTDGVEVTIDDYIYGIYVRSDPSYTGPNNTIGGSPSILGVMEYYYDDPNYSATIDGYKAEAADFAANVTLEQFLEFAVDTGLEGWWTGELPGDIGNGQSWAEYIEGEGYGDRLAAIDAEDPAAVLALVAEIEYDLYLEYYGVETWYFDKIKADYIAGNLEDGVDVPEISGIKRMDDYTCTVEFDGIDIYGDYALGDDNGLGQLAPRHYYGEITKGDVSAILANMVPMGSGPYVWGGFADNIVTCTANADYYLGVPKTGTVRWQYVPDTDILSVMASGTVDIAEPSASKENVTEMTNLGIYFDLIENAGYGYVGMNCNNLPLNVRKGLWSLFNREPSVEGYYGPDLASVIERPMTTVLAEYPVDAERYYEYSPEKALEYFEAAGYSQNSAGKLVNASGEQLVVNAFIGGEGVGKHPSYAMLVQAANDLAALGGELQIQDVQFNVLQGAMNDGTADMFCMAWGDVNTCDKSSQFHSAGGQNKYRYSNPAMDALLEEIVKTIDLDARRVLVAEMLDLAMEECIEYPVYQRNNMRAYNPESVNMDTIPESTAFYSYEQVLYLVEMN